MWANLHLLFWLSLIPVLTEWIGRHYTATAPAATYGLVCLGAAIAFTVLTRAIISADGSDSALAAGLGRDLKSRLSLAAYAAAPGLRSPARSSPTPFSPQWPSPGSSPTAASPGGNRPSRTRRQRLARRGMTFWP